MKLAGSRSYVLKGDGARLEQAVLRFTYDLLIERGYTPSSIPGARDRRSDDGHGLLPDGARAGLLRREGQASARRTAEVSLTSFHAKEILKEAELPKRYMAWSSCFRREAGTYGKDTSGLYRVHQFQDSASHRRSGGRSGVGEFDDELRPTPSWCCKRWSCRTASSTFARATSARAKSGSTTSRRGCRRRNNYGENDSCSTFYDFQSRRLGLRYKDAQGDNRLAHTLNNTAIASPRVLIPLLECHQTADGKAKIPGAAAPHRWLARNS